MLQRADHDSLDLEQPLLDVALLVSLIHIHSLVELAFLLLHGNHSRDDAFVHHQLSDPFKALVDVSLDSFRHFGLSQDLEQFLVWKEEEARKASALGLQILRQALLNIVQKTVAILELTLVLLTLDVVPHVLLSSEHIHCNLPVFVHLVEFQLLVLHFLLDVFRRKNRF